MKHGPKRAQERSSTWEASLPLCSAAVCLRLRLLFGLGLTARDGVLMLLGFVASGGAVVLIAMNISRLGSLFT